jgi:hypothetical protein
MTTTAAKPSLDQIRAEMISVRSEISALLKDTHFDMEIIDRTTGTSPKYILILTSRRMNDREFHPHINIQCKYPRYGTEPTGVSIVVPKSGGRWARDRVYTNINKTTYAKIKAFLVELEELVFKTEESHKASKANELKWNAVRAEQLSGMIEPPGMDCRIDMTTGPNAGKYYVRFHDVGIGLEKLPLNAEQVKRLATLVNEFVETENYRVIMAAWPEQNRVFQWTRHAGWRDIVSPMSVKVVHQKDVEAELEVAKQQAGNQWTVKVMPYAQVFTISPEK